MVALFEHQVCGAGRTAAAERVRSACAGAVQRPEKAAEMGDEQQVSCCTHARRSLPSTSAPGPADLKCVLQPSPSTFPCLRHGVPHGTTTLPRGLGATSWDYADATAHNVRGDKYLSDKKKFPSKPAVFNTVEVAGFSTSGPCRFYSELPDSYYQRARRAGKRDFLFIMHFDLRPIHTVIVMELDKEQMKNDQPFTRAFQRFLEGDDAYKNKRIKLLTAVIDANWMVKKAVGNPVPALIGNKLACYYRQTEDMCECTCDVNSSMAAAAIVGVVKGACKNIICDLFLMIEGQQDDELPERIFGGCRYIKNDLSSYKFIDGK